MFHTYITGVAQLVTYLWGVFIINQCYLGIEEIHFLGQLQWGTFIFYDADFVENI